MPVPLDSFSGTGKSLIISIRTHWFHKTPRFNIHQEICKATVKVPIRYHLLNLGVFCFDGTSGTKWYGIEPISFFQFYVTGSCGTGYAPMARPAALSMI